MVSSQGPTRFRASSPTPILRVMPSSLALLPLAIQIIFTFQGHFLLEAFPDDSSPYQHCPLPTQNNNA